MRAQSNTPMLVAAIAFGISLLSGCVVRTQPAYVHYPATAYVEPAPVVVYDTSPTYYRDGRVYRTHGPRYGAPYGAVPYQGAPRGRIYAPPAYGR